MEDHTKKGIPRFVMEAAVALITGIFGGAVCFGALAAGIGWGDMGPDAGYFPFYIGLLIIIGSAVNLVYAFIKHRPEGEIFLHAGRSRAVLGFFFPLLAFAAISSFLGLYVGTALYVAGAMIFQGHYKWWTALPVGIAVSLFFFVTFEIGFKVPLLKGPIEAWFGIY